MNPSEKSAQVRKTLQAMGWLLLIIAPAYCQEKPDAPKPKPKHDYIFVILHASATAADAITTRRSVTQLGTYEQDPIVRPFIGRYPAYPRMVLFGAAEVIGAELLAKKFPKMRWLQIGLTGVHATCAFRNSRF